MGGKFQLSAKMWSESSLREGLRANGVPLPAAVQEPRETRDWVDRWNHSPLWKVIHIFLRLYEAIETVRCLWLHFATLRRS